MFPNLTHGGSSSQWVSGWCGGADIKSHESPCGSTLNKFNSNKEKIGMEEEHARGKIWKNSELSAFCE